MALHINLYNEIHKQAQDRRRDPFKLAGLGGVLFALFLVCYYGYRVGVVNGVETQFHALQAEWTKLEPQQAAARAHEVQLLAQQKTNQGLVDRLQGRFYWAPFLERFAAVVPENVQITSFGGDSSDRKRPITVILTGVTAGQQPRTVAEQFRLGLQQKLSAYYTDVTAAFDANSLEDSNTLVQLNGQTLATATFKIRLQFKPEAPKTNPTPSPAPTVRERKK